MERNKTSEDHQKKLCVTPAINRSSKIRNEPKTSKKDTEEERSAEGSFFEFIKKVTFVSIYHF